MSVCNDVADYRWLTGTEAAALLHQLASNDVPLHAAIKRLRNQLPAALTHLLVEQADLRRRARAKFSAADQMFFTRVGLEQATDENIARYKASRFARRAGQSTTAVFADLCCGIGGDLLELSGQGMTIGVDCHPVAAHFAQSNASAVLPAHRAACVTVRQDDAESFELESAAAWHIDPDRRASGRRTTSLDHCRPKLQTLEQLLARAPHAAVKLAPATLVPANWRERCELEWISRGGECRQLVAWHGALARTPGQHRATIVGDRGVATRTVAGPSETPISLTNQIDKYVFDVDSGVLAARLGGLLATEYGLCALTVGATYLTGPARVVDPALACFEVDKILSMRVRTLAKTLRDCRIGELEIKKRGVDIRPEKLRQELKLRGENAATLLITPVAGRPVAILARRLPT